MQIPPGSVQTSHPVALVAQKHSQLLQGGCVLPGCTHPAVPTQWVCSGILLSSPSAMGCMCYLTSFLPSLGAGQRAWPRVPCVVSLAGLSLPSLVSQGPSLPQARAFTL